MVDFTKCKRVLGKAYNGANGKKIAVEYEGKQYMLKFPPSGANKPTELSYTNSCFSEHIASSIFSMLGINAQETMLGTFDVNGKTRIVCACRDFTEDGKHFYDFCSIKNTIIDSVHNGNGTELSDILETIEKQQFVNPASLMEHFWNMFVVDALLGNFDRHNGNWGFLVNPAEGSAEIAPIYDCGSCLLPQADEKVMQRILENEDFLNARIYQFPTSAIKLNDRKINYYDFLMDAEYAECNEAVRRIMQRTDIVELTEFVRNVPYLTDLQKEFYSTYLASRYDKILVPAFDQITGQSRNEAHGFSL